MLLQLLSYIKKFQTVSITQLSREFLIDAQAIKPMLDIWVKKGQVCKYEHPLACGKTCNACKVTDETYYSWVDC